MEQGHPLDAASQPSPVHLAGMDDGAQLLQQLADSSSLVFWVHELVPVNRVSFLSSAFERVWGMPAQAVLDDPTAWTRHIVPHDRERVATIFDEWMQQGFHGEFAAEYRIQRPDGGLRWIADRGRCWRLPDGTPYRLTGAAEDVSAQRIAEARAQESELHFKTLIEGLPHLVWTCHPDGRCDYLSPQWAEYAGESMNDDFTARWAERLHPDDRPATVAAWQQALLSGKGYTHRYRLRRHDGVYCWFKTRAVPLQGDDGRLLRWFGTLTDIDNLMQAEATLREERNRFTRIAESIPSVLHTYRLNADGSARFSFGSDRVAELFEQPAGRLRVDASSTYSRMDEASRTRLIAAVQESARLRMPLLERIRIVTPLRGERWLEIHSAPVVDAEGSVDWHGSFTDITERHRAEQALQDHRAQLRSLFEHLADGLITVEPDGRVMQWNRVAREMHGLPPGDEPLPSDEAALAVYELRTLDGTDVGRQDWPLAQLLRGETLRDVERRVHHRDQGWDKVFSYSGELVRGADGAPILSMLQVRDVTERRRNDDQLQQLTVKLEDRVRERTADLQAAINELEAFSYSVSHDLRAPLRAMDGFLQLLTRDFQAHLPETGQRYLRIVHDSARKMSQLIDDLLAFSRLSQQPLRKSPIDMHALVLDVIRQLQPMQQGRDVEWQVADLPSCEGDLPMLRQAWFNLLSNALKYSRPRLHALIEIGVDAPGERGQPEYYVRDNGSGFDMQHVHRLFGVFERLHRDDEFEGTGVGLALVQRIVQRHGGSIRAEAAKDEGATFRFSLGASR